MSIGNKEEMRIYITGCAKTGTTLLRRLMNAFEGLNVAVDEMSLKRFLESEYDVAKRNAKQIFSIGVDNDFIDEAINLIKDNNVKILHIHRNKEDVLKSDNGYVPEKRYNDVENQMVRYKKHITHIVHFEELTHHPDKVQKEVADALGLKIKHKFSEYPNFIDVKSEKINNGIYELRKIEKK